MPDWRRGYIRQYPWLRIQGKSAPGVHPPAPLATFPADFGTKGTSAGTLGTSYGGFSAPGVHPSAPLATDSGTFGPKGTSAGTLGNVSGRFRHQRYICRHPWHRIQGKSAPGVHPSAPMGSYPADFGAKGTSVSTFGNGFGVFRRQGYIHRHPWQRIRGFSAPEVHPPAPLATDRGIFGPKGASTGTPGNGRNAIFENKCLSLKTSNKTNHGRRKDYILDERGEQDSPSQQQSNS